MTRVRLAFARTKRGRRHLLGPEIVSQLTHGQSHRTTITLRWCGTTELFTSSSVEVALGRARREQAPEEAPTSSRRPSRTPTSLTNAMPASSRRLKRTPTSLAKTTPTLPKSATVSPTHRDPGEHDLEEEPDQTLPSDLEADDIFQEDLPEFDDGIPAKKLWRSRRKDSEDSDTSALGSL